MIIPVRCFSCGKVVAHLWEEYQKRILDEHPKEVLNSLGLERYCCRRMLLTHVELIDQLLMYSVNPGEKYVKDLSVKD